MTKVRNKTLAVIKEFALVAITVLALNSFVLASFEVPTGSMEDTVKIGDRLLVNKFIYGGTTPYTVPLTSMRIPHLRVPGFRAVRRGDVIVFDWPGPRDEVSKPVQMWYLKRCVAVAGDSVEVRNHMLHVNGRAVPNPPHGKFLRASLPAGAPNPYVFPRGSGQNEDNYGPLVVPARGARIPLTVETFPGWWVFIEREGHRAELRDGRVLVDDRETDHYTAERDYVFAMGDNRDDSLDSRFWGFVPVEDIVGTPMIVYWSWDLRIPISDLPARLASIQFSRIGTIVR